MCSNCFLFMDNYNEHEYGRIMQLFYIVTHMQLFMQARSTQ